MLTSDKVALDLSQSVSSPALRLLDEWANGEHWVGSCDADVFFVQKDLFLYALFRLHDRSTFCEPS